MWKIRGQDIDPAGVDAILSGKKMSGFNLAGDKWVRVHENRVIRVKYLAAVEVTLFFSEEMII